MDNRNNKNNEFKKPDMIVFVLKNLFKTEKVIRMGLELDEKRSMILNSNQEVRYDKGSGSLLQYVRTHRIHGKSCG